MPNFKSLQKSTTKRFKLLLCIEIDKASLATAILLSGCNSKGAKVYYLIEKTK